ncbi:BsuBI/PstI family type II restriction endonuclease [Methylophilus sp. 14]|uniref:BsuBI/PstI family type II restriction endonuclease n=1 Tax=Methylophilus sp. 14 TaxID=2781019 RepID=UPI00188DF54A|nr:BsuBI/PstI family type II restriction endonuclease [Methylophilus sp. 14]MBF4987056.1 restriction endonuclease [Methylophilus sp. 14]
MTIQQKIDEAIQILKLLGMPRAQLNERTALCLLCLLDLPPSKNWSDATDPLVGITPIMDWSRDNYEKNYAPNTRETFRRQSMHQLMDAGLCLYNPDDPERPVNSPKAIYQIEPNLLEVLRTYGTDKFDENMGLFLSVRESLAEKYAKARDAVMIPLILKDGHEIKLSPGLHSQLIKEIVDVFGPIFAPDSKLVYVGDTGDKHGYFDIDLLKNLGVVLDNHGKLPDVVLYDEKRNWLILIESVTSHGPVDSKRHSELSTLFKGCTAGLIFVSAFPNKKIFLKYLPEISWETEVWVSDAPTHMVHFNGSRFLGPY